MKKFDAGQQVICRFEDKPRLGLFIGEYVGEFDPDFCKQHHRVCLHMKLDIFEVGSFINLSDDEITSIDKVDFS